MLICSCFANLVLCLMSGLETIWFNKDCNKEKTKSDRWGGGAVVRYPAPILPHPRRWLVAGQPATPPRSSPHTHTGWSNTQFRTLAECVGGEVASWGGL